MRPRIGVDIGGTFTDVALEHPGGLTTTKVLTDHAKPEAAILRATLEACAQAGVAPDQIGQVIHGTTLVTNALIERRGAHTALITTEGFRDVIEMRSENRFEQYDLNLVLPVPLVARKDRLCARERVSARGEVLLGLDETEIARLVEAVRTGGYGAVAVGFLHAYANPEHERRMGDALTKALPGVSVSLSSVVSPQMRELPRINTTVANAYVRPMVAAYLARLGDRLQAAGIRAPVFLMHSGGGLIGVETAAEQPVRLLESGPAGGAIYAAGFARAHGLDSALSFDMGGTTAKICLVEQGRPKTASQFEIARTYRFKKGSGMVVSTPVVEMVEIGAGGGSIATVDAMGQVRVGPRSAGSEPGPACYGRGGGDPTVTDANLVLGRLDAQGFAGGRLPLDPRAARHALDRGLAGAGLEPQDAAFAVTEMVDENMANAARVHAVENGRDIESFAMIAFGGGAPLHACRLAEKLGVDRVIVPPGAGVGSAIGFLRAPFSFEATRGLYQRLDRFDAAAVNAALEAMEAEARGFVATGGGPAGASGRGPDGGPDTGSTAAVSARLVAQMRYVGQGWEIPVELDRLRVGPEDARALRVAFEAAYERLFGRRIAGLEVEITNWGLTLATAEADMIRVSAPSPCGTPLARGSRALFDAALRRTVTAVEVARADLRPGHVVEGPAIVTEDETSTIVTSAFRLTALPDGALMMTRKEAVA